MSEKRHVETGSKLLPVFVDTIYLLSPDVVWV